MTMVIGTDPDLRRTLIDDPSLIPAAVEEVLRLESPVQGLARTADRGRRRSATPRSRRASRSCCCSRRRTGTSGSSPTPTRAARPTERSGAGVRPRHPLLPRRHAGPARGPGRVRGVPAAGAGLRGRRRGATCAVGPRPRVRAPADRVRIQRAAGSELMAISARRFAVPSSARGWPASWPPSSCARPASARSRSSRRATDSAARGGRTAIRASPATCRHTFTATRSPPTPTGRHRFSPGPEIQAYFTDVARTIRHRPDAPVRRGGHQPRAGTTARGSSRPRPGTTGEFDVVIAATGVLHHPNIPDFHGLDDVRRARGATRSMGRRRRDRRQAGRCDRHRVDGGADHRRCRPDRRRSSPSSSGRRSGSCRRTTRRTPTRSGAEFRRGPRVDGAGSARSTPRCSPTASPTCSSTPSRRR